MNKLHEMLKLQQQLNDATNGKGWENGLTKQGKVIDWRRCIWLECAELVESFPWKHWKNIDAQPDYENIAIEVVDIWHFVMSEALRVYKPKGEDYMAKLLIDIESLNVYNKFSQANTREKDDIYTQIEQVESFVSLLFSHKNILEVIAAFFEVALNSDLHVDALYKLYIGKNILNQFRQDHGYKEGTYTKIWRGKEDNVMMQAILEENPNYAPTKLYTALKESYPN